MSDDEIQMVGYWNKDKTNPEITFDTRENDTRELVIITLKKLPKSGHPNSNYDINKTTAEFKKVSRELKNLTLSTRRLK